MLCADRAWRHRVLCARAGAPCGVRGRESSGRCCGLRACAARRTALDSQRDDRAAIASFERALAENPGDDEVLYFLARASLRAGDAAAALVRAPGGAQLVENNDCL
jgi:Tetratricopeptide repeat